MPRWPEFSGEGSDKYEKKTIYESRTFGGEDLQSYEKIFDFNRNELEGMVVLDLGAGLENKFANGLKEAGIDADIISVSPDYADEGAASNARRPHAPDPFFHPLDAAKQAIKWKLQIGTEFRKTHKNLVAAIGQQLPFRDGSFEREYALHVFEHIPFSLEGEARQVFLLEMARVLRPGGFAKVGPFLENNFPWILMEKFIRSLELQEKLKGLHVSIEKDDIKGKWLAKKVSNISGFPQEDLGEIEVDAKEIGAYNLLIKKERVIGKSLESAT